jgi:hypothetical protein
LFKALSDLHPSELDPIESVPNGRALQADEAAAAALLDSDADAPGLPYLAAALGRTDESGSMAACAVAMEGADALVRRGIAPPLHRRRPDAARAAMALVRSDLDVRCWAGLQILARVRSSESGVVATLATCLTAPKAPINTEPREFPNLSAPAACRALANCGPAAAAAAPALLKLCDQASTPWREVHDAVHALIGMGRESDVVALTRRDTPNTKTLAKGLARDRRAPAVVIPMLTDFLAHSKTAECVYELSQFGPDAAAALPCIKRHLAEGAGDELELVDGILAIDPADADAVHALDRALSSADADVSRAALYVFARRAAPSTETVDRLAKILAKFAADRDVTSVEDVSDALGRCGPAAKPATGDLVRVLAVAGERCADLRFAPRAVSRHRHVAAALGRIGPDAAEAIPALEALKAKGDETIRVVAAQALRRIQAKK